MTLSTRSSSDSDQGGGNLYCLGAGLRAIEFFAGIGGFATAWPRCTVELAIDVNQLAAATYRRNYPHRYMVAEIETLTADLLRRHSADVWWLSPPCQPYSSRGKRRDVDDPRAKSLLHLLNLIADCRPPMIALENVVGFALSKAFDLLSQTLAACGYAVQTLELCPTQLGWPNRRPRFYLLASHRSAMEPWRAISPRPLSLIDLRIPQSVRVDEFMIGNAQFQRFGAAMDRVDAEDPRAVTACFAGSYGKTLIRSGSYLHVDGGYRRFSPGEVAVLLGYPNALMLDHLTHRQAWKLLGNSLSIPAVRYILSHLRD